MLPDHTCVIGSATGNHTYLLHFADPFLIPLYFRQVNDAVSNMRRNCIANSLRLIVNFFDHKMLKAAFFCRLAVPLNINRCPLNAIPQGIHDLDLMLVYPGNFAIFHNQDAACLVKNGRYVRCNEVTVFTNSNNQRAVFPSSDQLTGKIRTENTKSVGTLNFCKCQTNGHQ